MLNKIHSFFLNFYSQRNVLTFPGKLINQLILFKPCVSVNYALRSLIQALLGVQIPIVFFQFPYRYLLKTSNLSNDFRKFPEIFDTRYFLSK